MKKVDLKYFSIAVAAESLLSLSEASAAGVAVIKLNLKLEQTSNYISESVTELNMLPQSVAIRKILD